MSNNILILVFISLLSYCHRPHGELAAETPIFENPPVTVIVPPGFVDEASGITDSKSSPGFLWVEQDSGNPPDLALLSYDAKTRKKVHLSGLENRDWEDITLARGPRAGVNYLYLAETGDNIGLYSTSYIYRFPEPSMQTDTVSVIEKIGFRYPNGNNDAEAILVDDITADIYVISKRESKSRLYKLPFPQNSGSPLVATLVGELPFNGVVSAAISPTGREIIVKTYKNIFYWQRKDKETIENAMKEPYATLEYQSEPQGEAICFRNDNSGFFTLSEKPRNVPSVTLKFYKRR